VRKRRSAASIAIQTVEAQFWVGNDMQAMLTFEKRYQIPAYMANNG
jgi:hypothetical protein